MPAVRHLLQTTDPRVEQLLNEEELTLYTTTRKPRLVANAMIGVLVASSPLTEFQVGQCSCRNGRAIWRRIPPPLAKGDAHGRALHIELQKQTLDQLVQKAYLDVGTTSRIKLQVGRRGAIIAGSPCLACNKLLLWPESVQASPYGITMWTSYVLFVWLCCLPLGMDFNVATTYDAYNL